MDNHNNNALVCCKQLVGRCPVDSPFNVTALGFYDGPTSGLAQCRVCGTSYRFDMLDWDDDHITRLMRMAPLPPGAFDEGQSILSAFEPPRFPIWMPFARVRPSSEQMAQINKKLESLLQTAGPPDMALVWQGYGERILAARRGRESSFASASDWFSREASESSIDWFSLLGFEKVKA